MRYLLENYFSCSIDAPANPQRWTKTCISCASDGVYEVKRMEEVRERVWHTLAALGISLPKGDVIIRVVGKDVIARQALKINARGNLHVV